MRRRTGFLAGILFELLAIFGLFIPYVLLVSSGTEIILKTVPVDPRSIFRGDYVMLGYEAASDIPVKDVPYVREGYQMNVYVVLEKKGDVYERVGISENTPVLKDGQVCLRAITNPWFAVNASPTVGITFPDLSQYFVEEGLGMELQSANNAHRLLVHAVVSPSCMAVLKGVHLGPEVPDSELPPASAAITKDIPAVPVE